MLSTCRRPGIVSGLEFPGAWKLHSPRTALNERQKRPRPPPAVDHALTRGIVASLRPQGLKRPRRGPGPGHHHGRRYRAHSKAHRQRPIRLPLGLSGASHSRSGCRWQEKLPLSPHRKDACLFSFPSRGCTSQFPSSPPTDREPLPCRHTRRPSHPPAPALC